MAGPPKKSAHACRTSGGAHQLGEDAGSMKKLTVALAFGALLVTAACDNEPTSPLTPDGAVATLTGAASEKTTLIANLTPELGAGNFVSSDDYQLCYDIFLGNAFDEFDFGGFKVDSNDPFENAFIETTISADKKELRWDATNATVMAVIMKGGSNYNLYDYHTPRYSQGTPDAAWDETFDYWLTSPSHQVRRGVLQYPEISHYNFCYIPEAPDGYQGCTPGYWRNHADRWLGVAPGDLFDVVFGVTYLPGISLGTAIDNPQIYGTFVFHAVAALLNAYGGTANPGSDPPVTVDYPYSVADVIKMVQDAITDGTFEATKNLFQAANELGCPLSGTRAVPVS
jgi:hypothetical protein